MVEQILDELGHKAWDIVIYCNVVTPQGSGFMATFSLIDSNGDKTNCMVFGYNITETVRKIKHLVDSHTNAHEEDV